MFNRFQEKLSNLSGTKEAKYLFQSNMLDEKRADILEDLFKGAAEHYKKDDYTEDELISFCNSWRTLYPAEAEIVKSYYHSKKKKKATKEFKVGDIIIFEQNPNEEGDPLQLVGTTGKIAEIDEEKGVKVITGKYPDGIWANPDYLYKTTPDQRLDTKEVDGAKKEEKNPDTGEKVVDEKDNKKVRKEKAELVNELMELQRKLDGGDSSEKVFKKIQEVKEELVELGVMASLEKNSGRSTHKLDPQSALEMSKGWEVVSASKHIYFDNPDSWVKNISIAEAVEGEKVIIFTLKNGDFVEVEDTKKESLKKNSGYWETFLQLKNEHPDWDMDKLDEEAKRVSVARLAELEKKSWYQVLQDENDKWYIKVTEDWTDDGLDSGEGIFSTREEAEEDLKKMEAEGTRKKAEDITPAAPKPTTEPGSGMKWILNPTTKVWEAVPETTPSAEVRTTATSKEDQLVNEINARWQELEKKGKKVEEIVKMLKYEYPGLQIFIQCKQMGLDKKAQLVKKASSDHTLIPLSPEYIEDTKKVEELATQSGLVSITRAYTNMIQPMAQYILTRELAKTKPIFAFGGSFESGVGYGEVPTDVNKSELAVANCTYIYNDRIITGKLTNYDGFIVTCYHKTRKDASEWLNNFNNILIKNNQYRGKCLFAKSGYMDFSEIPNVNWDDIIIDDKTKEDIKLNTTAFLSNAKLKGVGVNKRGLILYGPPGTAKTSCAKAIFSDLNDLGVSRIYVTAESFHRMSSSDLFSLIGYLGPTILVFEDVDLVAGSRDVLGSGNLLGDLLTNIDGMRKFSDPLVIMASTNRIEMLDEALSARPGRFDRKIELGLPRAEHLKKIYSRLIGSEVSEDIIKQSAGYTGSHVVETVNTAKILAAHTGKSIVDCMAEACQIIRDNFFPGQPKMSRVVVANKLEKKSKGLGMKYASLNKDSVYYIAFTDEDARSKARDILEKSTEVSGSSGRVNDDKDDLPDIEWGPKEAAEEAKAILEDAGMTGLVVKKRDWPAYIERKTSLNKVDKEGKETPEIYEKKPPNFPEPPVLQVASEQVKNAYNKVFTSLKYIREVEEAIAASKREFETKVRELEDAGEQLKHQQEYNDAIAELQVLLTEAKQVAVATSDGIVGLWKYTKENPFKPSDKWKLQKLMEKFPEAEAYLQKAVDGAQSQALPPTEIEKVVIYPQKGKERITVVPPTPKETSLNVEASLAGLKNLKNLLMGFIDSMQDIGDLASSVGAAASLNKHSLKWNELDPGQKDCIKVGLSQDSEVVEGIAAEIEKDGLVPNDKVVWEYLEYYIDREKDEATVAMWLEKYCKEASLKKKAVSEEEIHVAVKILFKNNPEPTDEQVHQMAVDIGATPEEVEKHIYKMFGELLKGAALTPEQIQKNVFKTDEENLQRDIVLEQEAVDVYNEHIKVTQRPHVKELLNHIIKEEVQHKQELEMQLKDLDKPLTKEQIDPAQPAQPGKEKELVNPEQQSKEVPVSEMK